MCRLQIWKWERRSGFTLIELVLVLVVAGVVIAMAVPRIDVARTQADSVTHLVRSTLQIAQRAALSRQHDVIVSFDTTKARIRVIWDADNSTTLTTGERVVWRSLETGNRYANPTQGIFGVVTASVTGAGLRTMDGMPTLTFHRDGSASTGAEIYLSTAAERTGITSRAIRLIQATGRADWYRRAPGGAWSIGKL